MTEIKLSDQDARDTVAKDLGRTLFVEAGAGTGKTTALVGRILNLVLTNDDAVRRRLSEIAAITFTEAAAAELRERIRLKFEDRLLNAEQDGDTVTALRCQEALADADIAAIQTLHGFAQRLLSEFPVEVGIPPRVEVIDEVRSQLAFEERWSLFLDSLYDDPDLEEFIVRASILGVKIGGPELRNVAHVFDDNWDRLLGISEPNIVASPIDFSRVHDAVVGIEELKAQCTAPDDKLLGFIVAAQPAFDRLRNASTDHERLRLVRALMDLTFSSGQKGNWNIPVTDAREQCKELRLICEDLLGEVASQTLTQFAARIAKFTVESAEARRSEGVLEFHDLLVLAHQLLRWSAEAREGLAKRYRVLMLDEFQDTDPIQISLALLLASAVSETPFTGDWSDLNPQDGRLFMVGDPKQSIYRFRRADIQLFLQARAQFRDGVVLLQENFRTVDPIIVAVNSLFSKVMPEDTAGQAKYAPLMPNRKPHAALDQRPLLFGGGEEARAAVLREHEAANVASILADIRDNPQNWLVEKKVDGKTDWREPRFSDVTILLPTRSSMTQLSAALDAEQIPFRADTGTLVYETQEVKDLLSVLRAIDDPADEIALVAALRSPLYSCGYDDLHEFHKAGGRFAIDVRVPDAALGSIVADGIEHIRAMEARKWWDEPSELLLRLIDERYAMALPAHGRRARDTWRRLRYVVDQARAFAESGGGDLRSYLEWTALQGIDGSKAHEPMLPEDDDFAVQIMTIHGSKGLEFPITIVSGMTTQLGARSMAGEVVWGGPGELPEVKAKKSVATARFDQQKELDAEMDGPERDRLLYVALTRARDHLVVSAHHGLRKGGKPIPSHGHKVSEWANAEGSDLVRWLEVETNASDGLAKSGSASTEQRAGDVPTIPSPADWRQRHQARLRQGAVRSTISATALARAVADGSTFDAVEPAAGADADLVIDTDEDVRDFDDGPESEGLPPRVFKRGRAGTAIGSAVHGVLQLIDLTAPEEADIGALCESQAWAESVPEHVDTIERAVRSALSADIVRACRTARHYKELYVASPVGSMTIEGYVDLLVETPEGLVVVDYKTDSVSSEADVDAKLAHYGLQGTAYALAVERATGESVVDVQFVFARPEGTIVRSVHDLEGQRVTIFTTMNLNSA